MSDSNKVTGEFENRLRDKLQQASDELDPVIAARLQAARRTALETSSRRRGILNSGERRRIALGFSMAVALVFAVIVVVPWQGERENSSFAEAMADMEMMSASEGLEFYEQLEFYQWLDEQHAG